CRHHDVERAGGVGSVVELVAVGRKIGIVLVVGGIDLVQVERLDGGRVGFFYRKSLAGGGGGGCGGGGEGQGQDQGHRGGGVSWGHASPRRKDGLRQAVHFWTQAAVEKFPKGYSGNHAIAVCTSGEGVGSRFSPSSLWIER